MAVLKYKDIQKMTESERKTKLNELRFELIKSGVAANKATAKTKEIKRAIARLSTFSKTSKSGEELKKK